jgi:hypothetical protein
LCAVGNLHIKRIVHNDIKMNNLLNPIEGKSLLYSNLIYFSCDKAL